MVRRAGFSILVALVAGAVFTLLILALNTFTRGEFHAAGRMLARKKAQYAAFSGLEHAEALLRKSRWYQPPGDIFAALRAGTFQKRPWGADFSLPQDEPGVTTHLFLDEIPSRLSLPHPQGTIPLLDSIRVLSLGSCGRETFLAYGKIIFEPEPLLDSASTEGVLTEPLWPDADIDLPLDFSGTDPGPASVQDIRKKAGDAVSPGDVLLTIRRETPAGPLSEPLSSPVEGTILDLFVHGRQTVLPGQIAATIRRTGKPRQSRVTVKRLTRFGGIPQDVYSAGSLAQRDERWKVYRFVDQKKAEFVAGAAASISEWESIRDRFAAVATETLSTEDVGQMTLMPALPASVSAEEAERLFVMRVFPKTCLPGLFPGYRMYEVSTQSLILPEVRRQRLNPLFEQSLELLGGIHGRDWLQEIELRQARAPVASFPIDLGKFLRQWEQQGPATGGQPSPESALSSLLGTDEASCRVMISLAGDSRLPEPEFTAKANRGEIRLEDFFYFAPQKAYFRVPGPESIRIVPTPLPLWHLISVSAEGKRDLRLESMVRALQKWYEDVLPPPPAADFRTEAVQPHPTPGEKGVQDFSNLLSWW